MDAKLITRRAYDRWATAWNLACWTNRALYRAALGCLTPSDRRVADVGCGTGVLSRKLARAGLDVVGIDLSPAMIDRARRRAHRYQRFEVGDAEALPLQDASFDALFNLISIHHYPHPDRALREFARVLAPSGRLVLVVFDGRSPFIRLAQAANHRLRAVSGVEWHRSVHDWVALAETAGFRQVRITPVCYPIRTFLLMGEPA